MPPVPRSSRRCVRFESDEDSDSGSDGVHTQVPLNTEIQARMAQTKIMMEDLSVMIRHKMTAQDAGPKAKPVNVMALKRGRECNQEGSEANARAMQNKQALNSWSNYGQTADAKAAGVEVLPDIAAGNSHRERVKREMQEQGVTKLEDTYDEHRSRGAPPAFRNHAGAGAAMANDRGRYGSVRGGGNAGRGTGRGASLAARSSGRPLDPAVDPDRPYVLKSKGSKKNAGIRGELVQGTVVVKATNKQQESKKKPVQYSSPRLDRGPLPNHVRQAAMPELADEATFMEATLNMFKKQAESGKHILAEKRHKIVPAVQATVQPVASTDPGPAQSELSNQAAPDLAKKSPKVQHIERKELGLMDKSPDAFTDGNATTPNLSGFTPSLASQDEAITAGNSLAGLGIQAAVVQDTGNFNLTSATDLMDVDVPGAKDSSLKLPLQASPRDSNFSTAEYEEYKLLKEFKAYMDARPSQEFTQWLNKQKSGSSTVQAASNETGMQGNASPVDISGGYTIGGTSLERILGDDKNVAARTKAANTKTTQTTPGLAQSKWASPEVQVLSAFKTKRKLDTIQEVSTPVESTQSTFSQATVINGTASHGASARVVQAKHTNPFARREESDSPAPQPIPLQAPAMAAESTDSSLDTVQDRGVRVEQQPRGQFQPTKSAGTKKGLSSSRWATDSFGALSVVDTPRQITVPTKSMNEASSIFGDSQNIRKSSGVLASISANTTLGTPIAAAPRSSGPKSIIGDAKNVQKSAPKWAHDPASRSAQAIERKFNGIKRSNAGPGYDQLMRDQKAMQANLEAEKAARGAESVDEMLSLADRYKNMYVGADDSDEEL